MELSFRYKTAFRKTEDYSFNKKAPIDRDTERCIRKAELRYSKETEFNATKPIKSAHD